MYSGSGTSIDTGVAGITAKKYLWIQIYLNGLTSATTMKAVLNGDIGANYALRRSQDGAADETFVNNSLGLYYHGGTSSEDELFVNMFIINNLANEKLAMSNSVFSTAAGAGTSPNREAVVNKWSNTSSQITDIELTGTYGSNSIMKIWGSN